MYCFAPANYALHNRPVTDLTEQKAAALSRLANQATEASYQMLSIIVNVLEPSRLMQYLPVRCWLFIVAANLHLLKVSSFTPVTLKDLKIDGMQHVRPLTSHLDMHFAEHVDRKPPRNRVRR